MMRVQFFATDEGRRLLDLERRTMKLYRLGRCDAIGWTGGNDEVSQTVDKTCDHYTNVPIHPQMGAHSSPIVIELKAANLPWPSAAPSKGLRISLSSVLCALAPPFPQALPSVARAGADKHPAGHLRAGLAW